MKNLIMIFVSVLLLLNCTAPPMQTQGINDQNAPMESKVIKVESYMPAEDIYQKAARILKSKGFIFNYNYPDVLKLEAAESENYPTIIKIKVEEINRGSVVIISGTFYHGGFGRMDIVKGGRPGSIFREQWAYMHNIATEINPDVNKLTYK